MLSQKGVGSILWGIGIRKAVVVFLEVVGMVQEA
jgi:hypothetical protein